MAKKKRPWEERAEQEQAQRREAASMVLDRLAEGTYRGWLMVECPECGEIDGYPDAVCTGAMLNYLSAHGEALRIQARDSYLIGGLDSQKASGKAIFGAGLLLSEKAAAEKAAATQWALSDRERAIQKAMEGVG